MAIKIKQTQAFMENLRDTSSLRLGNQLVKEIQLIEQMSILKIHRPNKEILDQNPSLEQISQYFKGHFYPPWSRQYNFLEALSLIFLKSVDWKDSSSFDLLYLFSNKILGIVKKHIFSKWPSDRDFQIQKKSTEVMNEKLKTGS